MFTRSHLIKGEGTKSRCLVPDAIMDLSYQPWTAYLQISGSFRKNKPILLSDGVFVCLFFRFLLHAPECHSK